ncbi:FUSC family protein [Actinoplanes sp. NPDC051411]|uniref:FUSC family protein n=1 Tax=Actinoplanes sp. NPDC051411 TaxID=3155522 RepID=UPI00344567A2
MRKIFVLAGPLAATVGTLAMLLHLGFGDAGMLVLGGALCVTQARRPAEASVAATLARLPLMVLATCGLGLIFAHSTAGADVVYLAVFLAARLAWRLGPAFDTAGRAVLLPLISLFLAPQVELAHHPATGILQVLVATIVAAAWGLLMPRLWKPGPPSFAPLAAAVRSGRGVRTAALELDSQLPPNATAARLAVLAVEASGSTPALATAKAALADLPPAESPETVEPDERSASVRLHVRTRLALQSTTAVALAFLAGQQLFGNHWPWTVITVLTVSLRATSRGEVAVTAAERLIGALAGTVIATVVGILATPFPPLGTLLIVAVLGVGLVLRQYNYAWWAAAMTASLSLLYGLLGEPAGLDRLGERLLAILIGGACTVLPFALLSPIRTRDAVRRRLGVTLRLLGAALREGPTIQNVRAADHSIEELRLRARPLHLTARLRPTDEASWAATLIASVPALHAAALDPAAGARTALAGDVRTVSAALRQT